MKRSFDTINTSPRGKFPTSDINRSEHIESSENQSNNQSDELLCYPEFNSPLEIDHLSPGRQKTLLNYANDGIVPSDPKKAADIALYCMEHGERKALLYLLSTDHGQADALDFSWHRDIKAKDIELLNDVLKKLDLNTKLHDLSLAECVNQPSPETIQAIAELIKSARTLKSLDLQTNGIRAPGIEVIAETLQNNQTLTSIDLSSNCIGFDPNSQDHYNDRAAKAIATVLENNSTLTSINLACNLLYGKSAYALANTLAKNSTLVSLDLNINNIGDYGAKAIATALIKQPSLTWLDLHSCAIAETGGESIAQALIGNSTLTFLDLSYNKLGIKSATEIADMLGKNETLTSLNLGSNLSIGSAGTKAIAGGIENNTTLHTLGLRWNYIDNEGAYSIARALEKNSSLITIDLSHNKIGYDGIQAFIYAMEKNHSLNLLDLKWSTDQNQYGNGEENKRAINEYLGQSLFSNETPITITHPDGRNELVQRKALPKEVTNKILSKLLNADVQQVVQTTPTSEEKKSIKQRILL
jgi:Ran GTPase-activating protein (RanGAP) involved in mRNA processing and transport